MDNQRLIQPNSINLQQAQFIQQQSAPKVDDGKNTPEIGTKQKRINFIDSKQGSVNAVACSSFSGSSLVGKILLASKNIQWLLSTIKKF